MKGLQLVKDNKFNLVKTFFVYLTYFCIGSITTLLGSSLLDLQILANTDFAKISLLIPIRSGGHIVGSAIAGFVGQKVSQPLVLSITNLLSGIFIGIAAVFTKFEYISACLLIAGINHGIADVLCNTYVSIIWKESCTNFLQALHMSWGIGSLLTPVITRPFLLPSNEFEQPKANNSSSHLPIINPIIGSSDVLIHYVFFIFGITSIVSSIPFLCIHCFEMRETDESNEAPDGNKEIKQNWSKCQTYTVITLVALIGHIVYSLEGLIGSLGTSFSVKSDLHMAKKTGVLLATAFWICFSFYRLLYIPLTFIISEQKLLVTSLFISTVGIFVTVPWANTHEICIWLGFMLIGTGMSPIFCAAYGMLAQYITMSARISSMLFIAGVIGESVHPAIAAALMANNPVIFLYYVGVLGISFIVLFSALLVYYNTALKNCNKNQRPQVAEARLSISISHF
ncbi:major facilitator superfamily domain-containing protein 4A [Tetranychus urticae]|uniref:Major facilitator superfamily (MFS) profile domain-containing protein n=1 Tax=Tetranychus urticae TaxID=32264 RepID=T1JXE1_TETUR|nr:major facilitator superfamily domain-containing protein 4A [Tetranychus urticae]